MERESYYNVRSNYARHPKIVQLRQRFGAEGVISLQMLWGYASKNAPSGIFEGATAEELCKFCDWPKGPDFVNALVEFGLLDKLENGGYSIHNWLKYQKHLK